MKFPFGRIFGRQHGSYWREQKKAVEPGSDRTLAKLYRGKYRRNIADLDSEKRRSIAGHNRRVEAIARSYLKASPRKRTSLDKLANGTKTAILLAKRRDSILLDGFLKNRDRNWRDMATRLRAREHRKLDIRQFSFFENPEGTIRGLRDIAAAEAECLSGRINFLDEDCLDLGPWLVLAVMRRDMVPVFTGGSIGDQLSAVIRALGLSTALRFSLSQTTASQNEIWAFPLRSRRAAGSSTSPTVHLDPQSKEEVADELCAAINRWLGHGSGLVLTKDGHRLVLKIVGETLDNAERFSRPEFPNDGDWSISGYMRRHGDGDTATFTCQLAFLSVGASINSSVQGCDGPTKAKMDEYLAAHSHIFPNQMFADDHLRTIFALQDRVSGDPNAIANGRGGTGFRDIITLFADLAEATSQGSNAKLAIVSGRTCLHVASLYCEVSRPRPDQLFNIWFNRENLKELPPDRGSVVELGEEFRGTLITMLFELDRDYLKNAPDAQH